MPKEEIFKQLEISREIKLMDLLCLLIDDFKKNSKNCAEFAIPAIVNKEHRLINFRISIQPLNAIPKERMN